MTAKYYYNPRCRKSREGLKIVEENKIDVKIVEYLREPPSEKELEIILDGLGIKALDLIRTQEKRFAELNLKKSDKRDESAWIKLMTENPILIERPILVYNGKVALGRPPENLLAIILKTKGKSN
jgi:arsenate reductase